MILLSHPTGNEFVREALAAFDRAGILGEFWTTISWNPEARINQLFPQSLRDLFGRRSFSESVRSRTHTVPLREASRLFAGAIGVTPKHDNCDAIYAYEDGALQSFRAAGDIGLKRIYDLPIGYWRVGQRIFAEEKEREPEWASTLTGTLDSAEKLGRKDDELRLATRVIVASTFTKQTLGDAPSTAKIDIVAYGAPPPISDEIRRSAGRLKVLFAGSLGQRKGLSYLLDAVEKLKGAVELTLLGRKAASGCAPLESAVRKHRWLPTLMCSFCPRSLKVLVW